MGGVVHWTVCEPVFKFNELFGPNRFGKRIVGGLFQFRLKSLQLPVASQEVARFPNPTYRFLGCQAHTILALSRLRDSGRFL